MANSPKQGPHNLTVKQQAFVDAWSDPTSDTFGDAYKSKLAAGYSETTHTSSILSVIPTEVLKAVDMYLLSESMKAAKAVMDVRDDPAQLGAGTKLKAADSILDRSGLVKKSQVEVIQESPSAIFVFPAKDSDESEADED